MKGLTLAASHISSFTNIRILHFTYIPLQREQVRFAFGKLGSTVSHLSLEVCEMDIDYRT